jgi:hypothetical protein
MKEIILKKKSGFFKVSLIFPNNTGSRESEKRTARKITAQRIPRFITRDIGVNFFSLKRSLAKDSINKTVKKTIISLSSWRGNEISE